MLKDGQVTILNQLNNHCTSYDLDFPRWGNTADAQFQAMRKAPWMAGEFVWTGLDYIGEPTPFSWPNRSSSFGIVDLAGFPKDRYYLYQSQWRPEPMVHLLPHWNWPDEFKGKAIPVWAYTNADSVELFLNDKSLGTRDVDGRERDCISTWQVPYEPGTLRAVAHEGRQGRRGGSRRDDGTGRRGSNSSPIAPTIRADGQDLVVRHRARSRRARPARAARTRNHAVQLRARRAAAPSSASTTAIRRITSRSRARRRIAAEHKAFHGLALAIVKSGRTPGTLTLRATAAGLTPAEVRIRVR